MKKKFPREEEEDEMLDEGEEEPDEEEQARKKFEEAREEEARQRRKKLEDHQTLDNLLQQERLGDALLMALDLAQPFRCLAISTKILETSDHSSVFAMLFARANRVQLSTLLDYAAQWNVNTRTYHVSQTLLNYALRCVPSEELLHVPRIDELVKALLPYTNRHHERLTAMRTGASHLDYVFSRMRPG